MPQASRKRRASNFPQGIAAYGTDALRFTFASLATQSRDLRFDLARVAGYRNFCNKLWNAARFVMLALDEARPGGQRPLAAAAAPAAGGIAIGHGVADRWIRSRLGATIRAVDRAFDEYRFDFAASALYEFTWYEFCDWYLEIVKPVLQNAHDPAAQHGARRTLLAVLEALLRALHPLMPFITEDIWLRLAPLAGLAGPSIMLAPWPQADEFPARRGGRIRAALGDAGRARHSPDSRRDGYQVLRSACRCCCSMPVPATCSSHSAIRRCSAQLAGARQRAARWRPAMPCRPRPPRWSASSACWCRWRD